MSCFWPRLPSALSRQRARSSLSATASAQRVTDAVFPPATQHLAVPEVRHRPHFHSRPVPGPLQPQVLHLVCVCELANVRDLQDHAPFPRQCCLPVNSLRCVVQLSPHEKQCQNTQHNRSSHHTFSSLPSCRSADVAPKADGQLRDVGPAQPLAASAPLPVTNQGRPRRAFQLSTFHRLSSVILQNPSCGVPKVPSKIHLWLCCTCNCSCYRLAVVDRFSKLCNELLPSTSRTSHVRCQAISVNPEETDRAWWHRHDVAYSLTPFSRKQVAAYVPVFTSFATSLRLMSSSDSTCSHASITTSSMLGLSRCNMVFDLQLGRSTPDRNLHPTSSTSIGMHSTSPEEQDTGRTCSFVTGDCAREQL